MYSEISKTLCALVVTSLSVMSVCEPALARGSKKTIGEITVEVRGQGAVQAPILAEDIHKLEDGTVVVRNPYALINGRRVDFAVNLRVQEQLCKIGHLGDFADASSGEMLQDEFPMIEYIGGRYKLDPKSAFSERLNETMCGGDDSSISHGGGCSEGCGGDNAHGGDT